MDTSRAARRPPTVRGGVQRGTSYAAQNSAVSAFAGSMGATKQSSPSREIASLTGSAKSWGWSRAGCQSNVPRMRIRGRIIVKLTITDPDDPRLADYVRLRETSLRRHLESEHGLLHRRGEKVIRRAVEAGYRPRSFLLAERWLEGLSDVVLRWPAVPGLRRDGGPCRAE